MRSMTPCPSPRGTNYERLFIIREPRLALDAAIDPDNGTTSPPDAGASSDAFGELYQFLAAKLDQRDLPEAETLLRRFLDASGGDGSGATLGTDEPPPFPGRPRMGGAMDARLVAKVRAGRAQAEAFLFAKRFPGASRIRVIG